MISSKKKIKYENASFHPFQNISDFSDIQVSQHKLAQWSNKIAQSSTNLLMSYFTTNTHQNLFFSIKTTTTTTTTSEYEPFSALSRISTLPISAKTSHTDCCQDWILHPFTEEASAYPSMNYCQNFWSLFKEENRTYPLFFWKYFETIIIYLGRLFRSIHFLRSTVYFQFTLACLSVYFKVPDTCDAGYYGSQCITKCHCANDAACNNSTGECPQRRCALGYKVSEEQGNCMGKTGMGDGLYIFLGEVLFFS